MLTRTIYYFIALFLTFSCSNASRETDSNLSPEQQEVSNLEDQVIEVHDQVMPQMGTLMTLKEQLEAKNETLQSAGTAEAEDQVIVNSLVIEQLDLAHEGMMSWMRSFEPIDIDGDSEGNREYLQQELDKIDSVKKLVDDAITAAEKALGDN